MTDRLLHDVSRGIEGGGLLRSGDSVLVAVSGGADSVALLAALVAINRSRWRIAACHVNHRLRGRASERDAQSVERLAKRLGCPCYVVVAPVRAGSNLEERARERRYSALLGVARRHGFRRVATAHTEDDQAETVLHHVLRGTGGTGLVGIQPHRADGVIRPLLGISRADLRAFLRRRGLRHRLDRTNRDPRFTRNRLRRRLLPLLERQVNPRVKSALARLAEVAREDEDFMEEAARRRLQRVLAGDRLAAAAVARMHKALQRRVIRHWLRTVRGTTEGITLAHVADVLALTVRGRDGQRVSIPGGVAARERGRLCWNPVRQAAERRATRVLRAGSEVAVPGWRVSVRFGEKRERPGPWRAIFDARVFGGAALRVRRARPGDRIRPLGLGGTKKLQDVFVDAKVPRSDRAGWPVVTQAGTIVWVPGLVRSDRAPTRASTARRLIVEAARRSK